MQIQLELPAGWRGMIRKVRPAELGMVREHFLRLEEDARRRRFGHDVSDDYLHAYAKTVMAPGNLAFAFVTDGEIGALAELKRPGVAWSATAEAAFTVERRFANRGLATELMGRIIRSARNRGVRHLLLYCMAENAKMQAIAKRHKADLRFEDGSIIADIVPKQPDCSSIAQEIIEDRFGLAHSILEYQTRLVQAR